MDKSAFYRYNLKVTIWKERIPTPYLRWEVFASALRTVAVPVLALWAFSALSAGAVGPGAMGDWARYSVLVPPPRPEPAPELFVRAHEILYGPHTLQKNEWNLWALARRYGTNMPSLQSTNNNELILVAPGTKLMVQNKDGLLYVVKNETESLDSIIAEFRKDPAPAAKLKQKVVEVNHLPGTALLGSYDLIRGETILLPGVRVNFDTYGFPFADRSWARISSRFGNRFHPILHIHRMHEGLDLPKPYGTKVYPSRTGRVVYADWKEGYGRLVEVRHADGETTLYGHLSEINVTVGQWVAPGKTLLGKVGSSGLSTGPHLHFEVRNRFGEPINPLKKIGRK